MFKAGSDVHSGNSKRFWSALLGLLLLLVLHSAWAAPQTFPQAKDIARQKIYADRNMSDFGTLYCGCSWRWAGRSGGRIDHASCGYKVRKNQERANRIEWEHIVPAWTFGHQRQCWQNGGRKNCQASDPVFNIMEADLHNLSPIVGEVNGDRSNYNFGMVSQHMPNQYGECRTRVDFKGRVAEPRDEAKGLVARVVFYMHDRYDMNMSRQQQQLLMAWDKQFPVTEWELERDRRIAQEMGHSNPFVTGERQWTLGYRPQGDGLKAMPAGIEQKKPPQASYSRAGEQAPEQPAVVGGPIIGNKNSRVYHLPQGCPSYGAVAPHNQRHFESEEAAKQAGFRKAGNCR